MDPYLAEDGDLLGDSSELPRLSLPLLPIPDDDVPVPDSATTHSMGGQFPVSSVVSPDLSLEGPFRCRSDSIGVGGRSPCVG